MGRELTTRFEAVAHRAGVERVWLLAGDRASGFYERIGYRRGKGLLDPEAERHVRVVKGSSVFVKDLAGPDFRARAEKR